MRTLFIYKLGFILQVPCPNLFVINIFVYIKCYLPLNPIPHGIFHLQVPGESTPPYEKPIKLILRVLNESAIKNCHIFSGQFSKILNIFEGAWRWYPPPPKKIKFNLLIPKSSQYIKKLSGYTYKPNFEEFPYGGGNPNPPPPRGQ